MVNFKIEITTDRVGVSKADRGWPPDKSTMITFTFLGGLAVYVITKDLVPLDVWSYSSNWPLLLAITFFAGSLLWGALRSLFPSGESLTCDRSTLTIGRIPNTSLRGRWNSRRSQSMRSKRLQFAQVRYSRYGGVTGLRFKADGKTKKILAGLESPEAAKILDALVSFGVNVVRDPAMPMMVDMALSRRKRWGGLF